MNNVISASRRTDIPAFYGDWFMERVREGAAGCVNPFGGSRHSVSMLPEDTLFIVFWSKNFTPFIKHLDELDARGFKFYFQFTITGHPEEFEKNVPNWRDMVETAHLLARRYSPEHVMWRFDPIVLSNVTPAENALNTFARLSGAMAGATRRCYFSFVCHYGKVLRGFQSLHQRHGLIFRAGKEEEEKILSKTPEAKEAFRFDLSNDEKIGLACALAGIAAERGISMHTCCGDFLLHSGSDGAPPIYKAHCVDGEIIGKLTGGADQPLRLKPTRQECDCYESRDIGAYDTCPHGCLYCYANTNKELAEKRHKTMAGGTGLYSLHPSLKREEFPPIP